MADLHWNGKLFRDLQPGNILLDSHGNVRLPEHQFAAVEREWWFEEQMEMDEKAAIEAASYLAPEQALNSCNVDARADLYSLGCTMYFMLVGSRRLRLDPSRSACWRTKAPSRLLSIRFDPIHREFSLQYAKR